MTERTRTEKKPVWYFNAPATILVLFPIPLMSVDAFTYLITLVSFSAALLLSYISVRKRFNMYGTVILVASAFFLVTVCLHLIDSDPNQIEAIDINAYP